MTRYILKYNTASKEHTVALSADSTTTFLMRVSMALVFLFLVIYIVEKDSLMLSERLTILEKQKIIVAQKNTSNLEIQASRMAASYNLKEIASQQNMVLSGKISYVNIEGDQMAMVR